MKIYSPFLRKLNNFEFYLVFLVFVLATKKIKVVNEISVILSKEGRSRLRWALPNKIFTEITNHTECVQ